jgi:hypothetical protein
MESEQQAREHLRDIATRGDIENWPLPHIYQRLLKNIPHTEIGEFLADDMGALGTVLGVVDAGADTDIFVAMRGLLREVYDNSEPCELRARIGALLDIKA